MDSVLQHILRLQAGSPIQIIMDPLDGHGNSALSSNATWDVQVTAATSGTLLWHEEIQLPRNTAAPVVSRTTDRPTAVYLILEGSLTECVAIATLDDIHPLAGFRSTHQDPSRCQ